MYTLDDIYSLDPTSKLRSVATVISACSASAGARRNHSSRAGAIRCGSIVKVSHNPRCPQLPLVTLGNLKYIISMVSVSQAGECQLARIQSYTSMGHGVVKCPLIGTSMCLVALRTLFLKSRFLWTWS